MAAAVEFGEVLGAAQQGAQWAVAVLYRDLHPRLARYLLAHEPRVAEDVEGEVWLAVAQRLSDFEGGEAAFRAWVFSIARRRLADVRRTAARRRTDPVPDVQLDRPGGDDPEAMVIEGLSAEAAAAFVVATLSPDQAEVVLLRVVGGLGVDEIAQLLGKRPGTIRVLQHRALRRLAARITVEAVTR